MKIREKNPITKELIEKLEKKTFESKRPLWKALAKALNRPRRKRHEVNLTRIEKYAKANEIVVVPGVVLGDGEVKKKLTIFALRFSKKAEEKIKKSGGKCLYFRNLLESPPKGRIRIMG
jgi:large subunit ribosomal protein L18e